jgi:hypothetical protein
MMILQIHVNINEHAKGNFGMGKVGQGENDKGKGKVRG